MLNQFFIHHLIHRFIFVHRCRLKDKTRSDEIRVLLQGIGIEEPEMCATEPLLPAMQQPTTAPVTVHPVIIAQPIDSTGVASVRIRQPKPSTSSQPPVLQRNESSSDELVFQPTNQDALDEIDDPTSPPSRAIPRSTACARRKRAKLAAEKGIDLPIKKPRQCYTCSKCSKPISSFGHTQFAGYGRFCPEVEGKLLSAAEWIAEKKALKKQKLSGVADVI